MTKTVKSDIVKSVMARNRDERRRRMVLSFKRHFGVVRLVKKAIALVAAEEHLSWWRAYDLIRRDSPILHQ